VALVIVMLVMAELLLAGTTFLTISSTESEIAANQYAAARAFAVAETALHRAIARLSGDATYAGDANLAVDGGTAAISVSASAQQICLSRDVEILATVAVRGGRAQARIKATADQAIYPFQWGLFAANGPVVLSSLDPSRLPWSALDSYDSRLGSYHPEANGGGRTRVGAKGGGVLLNNVEVVGDVVGDWISSSPNPVVNLGPAVESLPPISEPAVAWSDDPNVEADGTLTLSAGTYYYTALTLANGARLLASGGPVTVYVRGNVTAGDDVVIGAEPGEQLSLMTNSGGGSPSAFVAGETFRLFGSLYGTNTAVVLGDEAVIHGSIIARRFSGPHGTWNGEPCCNHKAPILHFDRAMMRRPVCTRGTFGIRPGTWREILP
jgi:hypothetical protein